MIFKLDDYFNSTKRKYVFVDCMMSLKNESKTKFLESFDIWYSTFRVEKSREHVRNNKVDKILDYYNVNTLNIKDKEKYEIVINEMYYAIYFMEVDRIKHNIDKLNEFIEENNILKPLFTLFKIYGYIYLADGINNIKIIINDEIQYIQNFKKNYFINEFEMIYESIKYSIYGVDNLIKLNKLSTDYPSLKWIYLSALGTTYYFNSEDENVIKIYEELAEEFRFHNNNARLMMAYSNICFSYNKLKRFSKCIEFTQRCLTAIYSEQKSIAIDNILMHYLYANFVIERYDEILKVLTNPLFNLKRVNTVTAFICILAAYKANQQNKVQFIIDAFKKDENILYLLEYLKTNSIKHLYKIKQWSYVSDIIKKLKHK